MASERIIMRQTRHRSAAALRRYIRENGLVEFAGDRVAPDELLPLALHSIQELNYQVGEFFDRALFYLARGYEAEAGNGATGQSKG